MCGVKKYRTDVMPCQSLHTRLSEIGTLAWFCGQPGRDPGGRHSQDRGTGSPQRADRSEIVSDWKQWIWTVDGQLMSVVFCIVTVQSTVPVPTCSKGNLLNQDCLHLGLAVILSQCPLKRQVEECYLVNSDWSTFFFGQLCGVLQISVSLSAFSEGKNVMMTSLKALLVWVCLKMLG